MLTHGNIASNLNHSTRTFNWDPDSSCISFLPLSHITARHLDYALFCYGATLAYCGHFDRLPAALTSIQPTVFVAVPRVYEKIRDVVERRAAQQTHGQEALYLGSRHRPPSSGRNSPGADALFPPLAPGRSFGFQESQAGLWRPGPRLYRRGSAAGRGDRGLVCRCRHSHLRRLRPHRNLARAGPEQCTKSPHRVGGQADRIGGIPFRSRWRVAGERARLSLSAIGTSRKPPAKPSKPTAGSTPAISGGSTKMGFSTSPTARRNCSRPRAER